MRRVKQNVDPEKPAELSADLVDYLTWCMNQSPFPDNLF